MGAFGSVGDRDVAAAAYMDVLAAVPKAPIEDGTGSATRATRAATGCRHAGNRSQMKRFGVSRARDLGHHLRHGHTFFGYQSRQR